MKLAILWWWYDMLPLCSVLFQYDHEFIFYSDHKHAPFATKSFDLLLDAMRTWVDYCVNQLWATACIVPPIVELALLHSNIGDEFPLKHTIFPLYTRFLRGALPSSRAWKIGLITPRSDTKRFQELFQSASKSYVLTENQQSTSIFQTPFALRVKSVPMRAYYLQAFSKKDRMVRKMVKKDTQYFRDADVDLLLPASWTCLYYEKILTHLFGTKRTFRKGNDLLKESFELVCNEFSDQHWIDEESIRDWVKQWSSQSKYTISVHTTDAGMAFLKHKKRERLFSRWGQYPIEFVVIS